MSVYAEKRRTARKAHRCITCDRPAIKPGDVYREFVGFPGWTEGVGGDTPLRGRECAFCAERYDRLWMLEPLPPEQSHRVYLEAMRAGRG